MVNLWTFIELKLFSSEEGGGAVMIFQNWKDKKGCTNLKSLENHVPEYPEKKCIAHQ